MPVLIRWHTAAVDRDVLEAPATPPSRSTDRRRRRDDGDGDDDDDVVVLSWWQHPANVIALIVATALIAGMIGWLIVDANDDEGGNAVDVGFLQDMRIHHEQAVEMAFTYLVAPRHRPGAAAPSPARSCSGRASTSAG